MEDLVVQWLHVAVVDGQIAGFHRFLEVYSCETGRIAPAIWRSCVEIFRGMGHRQSGFVPGPCVETLAQQKNIFEVMAITSAEEFFQRCGFDFTLPGEKKAVFLQTRETY